MDTMMKATIEKKPSATSLSNRSYTNHVQQLEKQVAWYKAFFEFAADAVFIVQAETWCILDVNERAAQILDTSLTELLGSTLPEFRAVFTLLSESHTPTVLSDVTLQSNSGNEVQLEVSARYIKHEGNRLILAIARDVTEQRKLNDRMIHADKMMLLGQLSTSVAHEIRNPLAAMNLNLQMLQRKLSATPLEQYAVSSLRGIERILAIVENTLNFAKPIPPKKESVDVNILLQESIEMVGDLFLRKSIKVETHFAEGMPLLLADSKQLHQVFINILTNACDAITTKGTITIRTSELDSSHSEPGVAIAITDDGCGITHLDLSQIFEPFFTRKAEGTGLGLPICQRIIHQHGGQIHVQSQLGLGSTFTIDLPISVRTFY